MRLTSKPILCNYYLTYRCNASCHFCDIWERPSPYIQLDELERNLIDMKKLGVKVIDFTGGEPLLHQKIGEILGLAKKYKFITTLTTNCLLYPKHAEKIKGLVDMLHFSLDSMDKESHDQGRGVACYDFVMQSIDIAERIGEKADILFTVFEHNLDQIPKVYEEICLKRKMVLILNPSFDYNQIKNTPYTQEIYEVLQYWSAKKWVYLNKAFLSLRKNGGNHIQNPICLAGSTTLVISPENKLILPCYHLGLEEIPIENNLYALYRSEEVRKLIALEGRHPSCEGCVINCYMQPSFSVKLNHYFWEALPSTLKYNYLKGTWKKLL